MCTQNLKLWRMESATKFCNWIRWSSWEYWYPQSIKLISWKFPELLTDYLYFNLKFMRCFSILPSASIYICSVFHHLIFQIQLKVLFLTRRIDQFWSKLGLPASKRHMLYSFMLFPFGSKKVHFRSESGQEQHLQLNTHDLKSEVMVKDGDLIDSHLIISKIIQQFLTETENIQIP